VLRIEFRDEQDRLEEDDWDAFFATFDEPDVDFLYQEYTKDGGESASTRSSGQGTESLTQVRALDLPADPLPSVVPGVRRLAVLRANGIGDYVVAEPALAALRAAYPDAEITLLGAAHMRPLVEGRPGPCDRYGQVPLTQGVRVGPQPDATPEVLEPWCAAQREHRYDLAVQMHGGGATATRCFCGSAPGSRPALRPRRGQARPLGALHAYQHGYAALA
jgi:hypothetical protein